MTDEYLKSLARLRGLRLAAGLTLKQLEIKSRGLWKSVVVGSYERGTRHLSLLKAVELCEFYGADLSALGQLRPCEIRTDFILDLHQLSKVRELPDEIITLTCRLANRITSLRGDRNGTVLSLREEDIEIFEVSLGRSRGEVLELLKRRGLLLIEQGLPESH
jgi:transcriptional regulator with XRE-family HTH domain